MAHRAYTYKMVSRDDSLPVSLETVKTHLRLSPDNSCENDYLILRIKTARDCFEGITRRILITTTFKTYRDFWQVCYELRRSALISIDSLQYYDTDNVLQTLDSSNYYITDETFYSKLIFNSDAVLPTLKDRLQAIEITFKAGFGGDAADIPSDIQEALLQHIFQMYENRGDCEGTYCDNLLPNTARMIYQKYKIEDILVN